MADTKNVLTPEELEALSSGIEDGSIESDTSISTFWRLANIDHGRFFSAHI